MSVAVRIDVTFVHAEGTIVFISIEVSSAFIPSSLVYFSHVWHVDSTPHSYPWRVPFSVVRKIPAAYVYFQTVTVLFA